jgi:hypothetical protein
VLDYSWFSSTRFVLSLRSILFLPYGYKAKYPCELANGYVKRRIFGREFWNKFRIFRCDRFSYLVLSGDTFQRAFGYSNPYYIYLLRYLQYRIHHPPGDFLLFTLPFSNTLDDLLLFFVYRDDCTGSVLDIKKISTYPEAFFH